MAPFGLLTQDQVPIGRSLAARSAAAHSPGVQQQLAFEQGENLNAWDAWAAKMRGSIQGILRVPHHGSPRPSRAYRLTPSVEAQRPDIVSRITAIRDLIQKEQIPLARVMLKVIPIAALEEPAVQRLRNALTPPTVRRSDRRDGSRTQTYAWLRQHGNEYQGQWVAVGEGGLIAAAPSLNQLRERLRVLAPAEQPLIHKL